MECCTAGAEVRVTEATALKSGGGVGWFFFLQPGKVLLGPAAASRHRAAGLQRAGSNWAVPNIASVLARVFDLSCGDSGTPWLNTVCKGGMDW